MVQTRLREEILAHGRDLECNDVLRLQGSILQWGRQGRLGLKLKPTFRPSPPRVYAPRTVC